MKKKKIKLAPVEEPNKIIQYLDKKNTSDRFKKAVNELESVSAEWKQSLTQIKDIKAEYDDLTKTIRQLLSIVEKEKNVSEHK